jgi:hypothetical protein
MASGEPPHAPPLDHEPVYRGVHPIRKGLAAMWVVFGLFLASPLIIAGAVAYFWWEVMLWLTRDQ